MHFWVITNRNLTVDVSDVHGNHLVGSAGWSVWQYVSTSAQPKLNRGCRGWVKLILLISQRWSWRCVCRVFGTEGNLTVNARSVVLSSIPTHQPNTRSRVDLTEPSDSAVNSQVIMVYGMKLPGFVEKMSSA